MRNKKIFFIGFNIINSLFTAVSIVAISTILVLNFRFLYRFIIDKYNLVSTTGLSSEILMINYNKLINYLENPFINKLELNNFSMSSYGKVHFYEVKRIFLFLIIVIGVFVFINITYINICKLLKIKKYKINIIKNLNLAADILIIFFIILILAYTIDFSKAFILFHKIFFRNNYWIFDANTDPIINALPEELFMIYGGIILGIIMLISIVIKIIKRNKIS